MNNVLNLIKQENNPFEMDIKCYISKKIDFNSDLDYKIYWFMEDMNSLGVHDLFDKMVDELGVFSQFEYMKRYINIALEYYKINCLTQNKPKIYYTDRGLRIAKVGLLIRAAKTYLSRITELTLEEQINENFKDYTVIKEERMGDAMDVIGGVDLVVKHNKTGNYIYIHISKNNPQSNFLINKKGKKTVKWFKRNFEGHVNFLYSEHDCYNNIILNNCILFNDSYILEKLEEGVRNNVDDSYFNSLKEYLIKHKKY